MSNDDDKCDDRRNADTSLITEGQPPATVGNKNGSNEVKRLQNRLDRYRRLLEHGNKWEFRFSAVIATAAVVSAVVGGSQWYFMSRQLDEMDGNSKQTDKLIAQVTAQAEAVNRLAEIARESLAESRDHSQRDLRPYVIPSIEPGPLVEGLPITARHFLVNYGKSPALKTSGYMAVFVGKDALSQADKWFAEEINQHFNTELGAAIPPGVPFGVNRERSAVVPNKRVITKEDIDLILRRDYSVVIVSRHLYFDGLEKSYGTDTCFMMTSRWEAAICPRHNEIH